MTASTNNSRRSGGGNSSTPGLEQVAELHAGIYPRDMPIEQLAPTARRMVTSIMSMPSPSVPASEPRASASSEPSPATGRSATSRSRSSRKTSCSPAWRMDSLRLLPSGEISNDSTGDRGVAQWISSLLATRVSRSPSPDDGKEPRTLDISGPMSHACYERPERPSSSARTSPDTCPSASERSEKNWKAWATRLRQDSLRRLKSARLTSGSASSSSPYWGMWPTPTASLTNDGETPESFERRRRRLQETGVNGNGAGTPLTIAAKMWQTPRASDGPHGGPNGSKGDLPLPSQSIAETEKLWATPTARDWKDGGGSVDERADELPAWPPGPEEHDLWRRIIAVRPDLAPATPAEPRVRGVADGPASRVDSPGARLGVRVPRLKGLGNSVVPACLGHAFWHLAALHLDNVQVTGD